MTQPDAPVQGPTGFRLWLVRGVALGFATLLGLGMGELVVRGLGLVAASYQESDTAIVLHYVDPNGLIKLTPNWEGYVAYQWTTFSAQGFRDRVYPAEPPPGTTRIAVLGDSYTMGDGVPLDATYPKQLERLLCERARCEVMNAGISATNSHNHLERLRELLRDFHPDMVVLGYNINDFYYRKQTRFDDLTDAGYDYTVLPDGRVKIVREYSWAQRAKLEVSRHSYLYRWVVTRMERVASRTGPLAEFDTLARTKSWIDEGGHLRSFQALEEMQRLCKERGIPFLILILPGVVDMPRSVASMKDYPYGKEHEMMHEQMSARGIEYLDLLPAFGDEPTTPLAAHPFDRHYSRHGNEIVAKAAAERIAAEINALQQRAHARQ